MDNSSGRDRDRERYGRQKNKWETQRDYNNRLFKPLAILWRRHDDAGHAAKPDPKCRFCS